MLKKIRCIYWKQRDRGKGKQCILVLGMALFLIFFFAVQIIRMSVHTETDRETVSGTAVSESSISGSSVSGEAVSGEAAEAKEEEDGEEIPKPSSLSDIQTKENETVNLIDVYMPSIRMAQENKAVNRMVTLPAWLNAVALEHNMNFSQVLQEALKEKLHVINSQ